jgi:hypothetical protein
MGETVEGSGMSSTVKKKSLQYSSPFEKSKCLSAIRGFSQGLKNNSCGGVCVSAVDRNAKNPYIHE